MGETEHSLKIGQRMKFYLKNSIVTLLSGLLFGIHVEEEISRM